MVSPSGFEPEPPSLEPKYAVHYTTETYGIHRGIRIPTLLVRSQVLYPIKLCGLMAEDRVIETHRLHDHRFSEPCSDLLNLSSVK